MSARGALQAESCSTGGCFPLLDPLLLLLTGVLFACWLLGFVLCVFVVRLTFQVLLCCL